jgi:hypothetical protein
MENQNKIESNSDFANTPAGMAQRWDTEITASKKELKKWHDDAIKQIPRPAR